MLKRGLSATIDEWLNAAEYIISEGNPNIVLCERGIRTYETATRNTLDISAVPVIRSKSHLPVIIDPSHATGVRLISPHCPELLLQWEQMESWWKFIHVRNVPCLTVRSL